MTDDRAARLATAKQVAGLLASPAGRARLRDIAPGVREAPVIVALESDTLGSVHARIQAEDHAPPVVVAFTIALAPTVPVLLALTPATTTEIEADDDHSIHADSTLGWLMDYLMTTRRTSLAFHLSHWSAVTVDSRESVSAPA